jgi:universal stress protein F
VKKILVGLDSSPFAFEVLGAARALAQKTGAKLILLRAFSLPTEIPVAAYALPPLELEPFLRRLASESLMEMARQISPELFLGMKVWLGAPWQALCEVAKEEDVDLIVLGAHGYGLLERMIGTTTAKVVNHADRSVLVVRAPERLGSLTTPAGDLAI